MQRHTVQIVYQQCKSDNQALYCIEEICYSAHSLHNVIKIVHPVTVYGERERPRGEERGKDLWLLSLLFIESEEVNSVTLIVTVHRRPFT